MSVLLRINSVKLKVVEKKLKVLKIEVSMRNSIKISLFTLLLPMAANKQFNIDNRVYKLESIVTIERPIISFHEGIELSDREIIVDVDNVSSTQPIQLRPQLSTNFNNKKTRNNIEAKQRHVTSLSKFKNFRSSFKGLAKYWPTKASNPIAKKEIKLEKLVKLEIPRPVLVKKIDLNKDAIALIDTKFAIEAANENDYIESKQEINGKVVPVKISLLTLEIQNHLKGNTLDSVPSIPKLAVEEFKEESFKAKLAFLDEDVELDRLITAYQKDKVKLSQSAIKQDGKNVDQKNQKKNDDLVLIDLKARPSELSPARPVKKSLAEKLADVEIVSSHSPISQASQAPQEKPNNLSTSNSIISQSVKDAIDRTLKQVKPSRNDLLAAMGKSFANPKKAKAQDFSKFIAAVAQPQPEMMESAQGQQHVIMRPMLIDLNAKLKDKSLHGFDVVPSYNLNDILTDAGGGSLKLDYPLFSEKGLFHGSLIHRDTVRVNFEVALGAELNDYSVPVFDLAQFNEYLTKNNASVPGGFVLVEYSDGVESVDIEKYERVLNLDQKFQVIKDESKPEYSLFIGVEAGNVLLRVLNDKGEIGEKVLFAYDDEVTFSTTHFESSKKVEFTLYKESLLGKKSPLSLDSESIQYFNLPINPERKTLNTYSIKSPPLLEGMRRYLEVKSGDDLFIIGTDKGGDLSIPTRKTLDFYLSEVNLADFQSSCIVQLNTGKPIESVQLDGITGRGPMLLDTHFLNDDGQLFKNIDGVVRKAFITGDYQGTLYLNMKYVDGTQEVARTYCSPGTYVIENF